MMTLLVVAFLFSIVTGTCLDKTSSVIWIHGPTTFFPVSYDVNGCRTTRAVGDVLSYYYDRGYAITHHEIYDKGASFSWILVKQKET